MLSRSGARGVTDRSWVDSCSRAQDMIMHTRWVQQHECGLVSCSGPGQICFLFFHAVHVQVLQPCHTLRVQVLLLPSLVRAEDLPLIDRQKKHGQVVGLLLLIS